MGERTVSFPDFTPTAGELIRHCAAKCGDQLFVVLGEERLTYAEVDARSAALAKGLLASGVGKGSRVGLLAPNGPDWIIGWLAGARIGAVVSMFNTYSKARELGWVLRHSDVSLLLTADRYLGHDYLARLEDAMPGLAEQTHEHIHLLPQPYLRSVWSLGDADREWAGSVADLAARSSEISDELLRAVEDEVTPADPM